MNYKQAESTYWALVFRLGYKLVGWRLVATDSDVKVKMPDSVRIELLIIFLTILFPVPCYLLFRSFSYFNVNLGPQVLSGAPYRSGTYGIAILGRSNYSAAGPSFGFKCTGVVGVGLSLVL